MFAVQNNLGTIAFPLTLKRSKIMQKFPRIRTPGKAILLWFNLTVGFRVVIDYVDTVSA